MYVQVNSLYASMIMIFIDSSSYGYNVIKYNFKTNNKAKLQENSSIRAGLEPATLGLQVYRLIH